MGSVPVCCGSRMKVEVETSTFIEVRCPKCEDVIYIKKRDYTIPELIDD